MNISETWLRSFVNPDISSKELAEQLTMAGLEVGSVTPAAPEFTNVVTGKVVSCERHPNAEKLSLCRVDVADEEPLSIVCGAPNVREGLTVAVAKTGARLPGGLKIRRTKLRGEVSEGMICSARELGLGDEHDGILELPEIGDIGTDFRNALDLDDQVLELELTPNRGDCLGVYGVAREVAAINGLRFEAPHAVPIAATIDDKINVHLESPVDCSLFAGRVIKNLNPAAETPLWMCERLRRAGLRAIHPVVDITNYVMLESGKPMHGFDLATMRGDVRARRAKQGEKLTLLDGREIELTTEHLVIADDGGPRALAGIMGGVDSGVVDTTTDVFLESAFFNPLTIAGKARAFGLHTDASHRFERGVDPSLCVDSIERATELILDICGGQPGPVVVAEASDQLPVSPVIDLTQSQLEKIVGRPYDKTSVTAILDNLGLEVTETDVGWQARVPSYRFDLSIAEDLVEEIARIDGYDQIEAKPAFANLNMAPASETRVPLNRARDVLISRGYREAITYSFIDPKWHTRLFPEIDALALENPISADLAVMRTSTLPGLLMAAKNNQSRQRKRVRLFETGLRFIPQGDEIKQESVIGVVACGPRYPEQWGRDDAEVDFFDLKNDIEAVMSLGGEGRSIEFVAKHNPVFHPGQTAQVLIDGRHAGWIGQLHPQNAADLEFDGAIMCAELLLDVALEAAIPAFRPISRYPEVRRDLSFIVDEAVSIEQVESAVASTGLAILKQTRVFDIYRGKGIEAGTKSIALGLILQDSSRTLTDVDADEAVAAVTTSLKQNLQAKIRD